MQYIVFDLEFNQDYSSLLPTDEKLIQYPFEIIQIGAIKLDSNYKTIATFNRYVKPTIYSQISTLVTDLTGITADQLKLEKTFPDVFQDYIDFIGDASNVFCIWGMSDIKELFRNADYHKLDKKQIPLMYINIQPYVSLYLELPQTKLINLQVAIDALHILKPYRFHNALNDAYYTAEIFKKLKSPTILTMRYDPNYIRLRPRQQKKTIDFEMLIKQFEKMYARQLTTEEQELVKLAYKMGKTNQFVK